ncbi:MAG TPA: PaaI family thioesterase [Acidobacteriota bacterium]|nr:PaaI family thioesterase [Acidobacteriota bacterium]
MLQGYPAILHGGVVSLLLDGVMTNCLFSAGITAVTGRLEVRYLRPVAIDQTVHLSARILKSRRTLHYVEAELVQESEVKVTAVGSFVDRRAASG